MITPERIQEISTPSSLTAEQRIKILKSAFLSKLVKEVQDNKIRYREEVQDDWDRSQLFNGKATTQDKDEIFDLVLDSIVQDVIEAGMSVFGPSLLVALMLKKAQAAAEQQNQQGGFDDLLR